MATNEVEAGSRNDGVAIARNIVQQTVNGIGASSVNLNITVNTGKVTYEKGITTKRNTNVPLSK